jgi:hypothetical protein
MGTSGAVEGQGSGRHGHRMDVGRFGGGAPRGARARRGDAGSLQSSERLMNQGYAHGWKARLSSWALIPKGRRARGRPGACGLVMLLLIPAAIRAQPKGPHRE